jgi:hypothetical protein
MVEEAAENEEDSDEDNNGENRLRQVNNNKFNASTLNLNRRNNQP